MPAAASASLSGNRAQAVAEYLERGIVERRYVSNAALPPERELAEQLGVSRATLREGIGLLVARGLLARRHGVGTFVSDRVERQMAEVWADMVERHPALQGDLIEFREMLESRTAELAAARATPQERARLTQLADELDTAYRGDDRRLQVQADVAFHRAIADASHNPVFSYLTTSLLQLLHEHVKLSIAGLAPATETALQLRSQHRELCDAIVAGDTARARSVASRHMEFVRIRLNDLQRLRQRGV